MTLYEGVLECVNGKDDATSIKQLREMFTAGFQREPWSFDDVLKFARTKMSDEDYNTYVALADGILDETKVPDVDALLASRARHGNTTAQPDAPAATNGNSKPRRNRRKEKAS